MTSPAVPPAIDYSSRDYNSLLASMLDYAGTLIPEWTSRGPADFGLVLTELFAYMGDILSYYIDRSASEAFLSTAAQRSSILAHAALMGYRPQAASPAHVTIQFTASATVTIPARTRVATMGDATSAPVYFETVQDLTLNGSSTSFATGTVNAYEGESVAGESLGNSTGAANQYFQLGQSPVIESSVVITVQDDPARTPRVWNFVDNLVESAFDAEVFTLDTSDIGQTLVVFGNGVTGKIPVRGAVIRAGYRVGGGSYGNVVANTVTVLADPVSGVTAVTNPGAAAGGADEESLDSIRANAPAVYRASNRAVTTDDHAALALRVPGVAMAKALSVVYTNVTVFVAPAGGGVPDANLIGNVSAFVQALAMTGVTVRAAAVAYVPVDVTASVVVYDQYNQESVRVAAFAALSALFGFGQLGFGTDVTAGAVYQALMSVAGVKSASISLLAASGGSGVQDIAIADWQIGKAGALQVSAAGGIIPGASTSDIFGSNAAMPTPTAAPTVTATRNSTLTHLNVSWTSAANNTLWYLEVTYKDGSGGTRSVTTYGSFATVSASLDIGRDAAATSIQVRVESYNGTTGPVYSPTTTVANPS